MWRNNSKFYLWFISIILCLKMLFPGKEKDVETWKIEFWLVSTWAVKIWDHVNENLSYYLITKWYKFFWNTLYISSDINFLNTMCIYIYIYEYVYIYM